MRVRPSCNISHPLRWSIESAAREFDWHSDTLKKKLIQAEQVPVNDCYGTVQIVTALFGDIAAERLRKTREEADNMALKNAILRGESLPKGLITPALEAIFTVIGQLIMASGMSSLEKKDLMDAISSWPVAVKNVEQKISKEIGFSKSDSNGETGQGQTAEG